MSAVLNVRYDASSPSLARLAFLLTGDRQLGEDLVSPKPLSAIVHKDLTVRVDELHTGDWLLPVSYIVLFKGPSDQVTVVCTQQDSQA